MIETIVTQSLTPPVVWTACSHDHYMEMLCVLPPERSNANGFLVGEPSHHRHGQPCFAAYRSEAGQCYSADRALTVAEFKHATEGVPLPKPQPPKPVKRKKESSAPRCVFCGRSENVQFVMFNPRFKPFGTACYDCETTLPAGTTLPATPATHPV